MQPTPSGQKGVNHQEHSVSWTPKPIFAEVHFGGLKTWPNLPTHGASSTVRVALFVESFTLVLERTQTAVARIGYVTIGGMQDAKCDLSPLNLSRFQTRVHQFCSLCGIARIPYAAGGLEQQVVELPPQNYSVKKS